MRSSRHISVTLGGESYDVQFEFEHYPNGLEFPSKREGKQPVVVTDVTRCNVFHVPTDGMFIGVSSCSAADAYDYMKGVRQSLDRAFAIVAVELGVSFSQRADIRRQVLPQMAKTSRRKNEPGKRALARELAAANRTIAFIRDVSNVGADVMHCLLKTAAALALLEEKARREESGETS